MYKTKHFQFYTDICAKHLGGAQTYFWEMCTIQRFSAILIFMPNICGGKLKYGNTKTQLCLCRLRVETYIWDLYKTKHFQFYTDIHAKHLGGGYIFLKYHRAEPQFLFSFWYRNINIPKYDEWGGWWGFGMAHIAEISVFCSEISFISCMINQ